MAPVLKVNKPNLFACLKHKKSFTPQPRHINLKLSSNKIIHVTLFIKEEALVLISKILSSTTLCVLSMISCNKKEI